MGKALELSAVSDFKAVKPRAAGLKIADIPDGNYSLSIGTTYRRFDKEAYQKKTLTPNQKAWVESLQDEDGIISCTLKSPEGSFPTSLFLSLLKSFSSVKEENKELVVKNGAEFTLKQGVLCQN